MWLLYCIVVDGQRIFCIWYLLFFFTQKTAYELRISDWSSDVCSSDLTHRRRTQCLPDRTRGAGMSRRGGACRLCDAAGQSRRHGRGCAEGRIGTRSEEITSELQSLMRLSYTVFCFKK